MTNLEIYAQLEKIEDLFEELKTEEAENRFWAGFYIGQIDVHLRIVMKKMRMDLKEEAE